MNSFFGTLGNAVVDPSTETHNELILYSPGWAAEACIISLD
jgi:hypothetical protein